jgi:seryl-tRNA synthetase
MVLDIGLFRKDQGGDPELVRESQRRRFKPVEDVDAVIEADEKLKKVRYEIDQCNSSVNKLNEEIKKKKMQKENADELIQERVKIEQRVKELKDEAIPKEKDVQDKLRRIGNIVHQTVPVSKDEELNEVVAKWGECKTGPEYKHHHEVMYMTDAFDMERGVKVSGHRGYFLKGVGVQMNFALIQYGMDFLRKQSYTLLQTPFMMNKAPMSATAQLEQFDEELYKLVGGDEEKYLIATSEQPISAYHQDEWLEPKQLPLRYGGFSTCFRKEAGSHGKDTWGIFRVHQFEKVEQFCISSPETSWEMHEEMLKISEQFYQSLGIPYRVVAIVSGELNNAAAKKYDLEGWFPSFNHYRELVSCSNCTDYQSRSLEIRYGSKKQGGREKKYVHMLNSTLCATTRTISAIMENYQTPDGVRIPTVLQPYFGGQDFIPFVHKEVPTPKGAKGPAAPKDATTPKDATPKAATTPKDPNAN